jgi:hypothetical protein
LDLPSRSPTWIGILQVFILKNWEGDADEGDDGGDEDEEKAENPAADAADDDE